MANIKELTTKPEILTGGHRLCAGCGAPIVVRQVLAAAKTPVVVVSATGCLEVSTTIYPYTAWNCSWIHVAFENVAAVISGVETMYRSLKKQGKITEDYRFIAFGGDGGTYDIGIQALSGMLERGHQCLYVCYNNEAYMNCLSISSLIMTKRGLKKITEIKKDEEIYAFDQKTYNLILKKCLGVFDNGVKKIFELETLHHSIKATGNHPLLVLKRNGVGKKNNFIWKILEQIKIGDEIVTLKNLDEGKSFKFTFKKVKKGDYKVNRLNEVNLPEVSTPDLMKYLGIYVGDGWVIEEKGEVGFALPENSKGRKNLIELHSKIFGGEIKKDKMYVYINSVNIAKFINSLGFGKGAKNKIIPSWIFTLPKEERGAFIEGLMLSDGYKIRNSFRYVSASKELLRTLRLLLQITGYRVGKIHQQKKNKGEKCVKRELLKDSTYGYICFSKRWKWNTKKYPSQYKYQNFLIENKYFEIEKVKSMKLIGEEPTLDLRVEDEHDFIADGIVVHNTGIQRSGATPRGADTTTSPVGKVVTIGKSQERKDLTAICAAHNVPYVAQASPAYWNDLVTKTDKALNCGGASFMNIIAPCPRGWRYDPSDTIQIAKLAAQTCVWPLYEVENGKYKITYRPKEKLPVTEWLKNQGRFRHLFKPENAQVLEEIQKKVDADWEKLQKLETI